MKLFFESANSDYLNSIIDNIKQLANSEQYSKLLDEAKILVSVAQKLAMNSYKIWNIYNDFNDNELTKNINEEEFLKNLFRDSDIRFNSYSWSDGILSVMSDTFDDLAESKIRALLESAYQLLTYEM